MWSGAENSPDSTQNSRHWHPSASAFIQRRSILLPEALEMLESLRDDPRSAEAYAAALFAAGREADAVAVLQEAAANGDDNCRRQLLRWQDYAARRAAYEHYLKQIAF